jgi:uncharacterized protein (TIGR02452 family)
VIGKGVKERIHALCLDDANIKERPKMNTLRDSKFLSYVLRHSPETIGITLDENGWIPVSDLLEALADHGKAIDRDRLQFIIENCPKKRFALSEDGSTIRANQGHSVTIDLDLEPSRPPATLFHGTVAKYVDSIRREGLQKRARHHVHLSPERDTATSVGSRRGKALILEISAAAMFADGYHFYCSENGVWLTDCVPPAYIRVPENRGVRKRLAEQTLDILKAGFYETATQRVDIAQEQAAAEAGTRVYRPADFAELRTPQAIHETEISVAAETTLAAGYRLQREGKRVLCLNFASARNPGGGFLGGSQAQEESIARSSGLYPCLLKAPAYYEANRPTKGGIYTDHLIYSPDVPCFRDDNNGLLDLAIPLSVITGPAPNRSAVPKGQQHLIEPTFRRRIDHVLTVAAEQGHDTLVLGAWGCGVFRNAPVAVASYFADALRGRFALVFRDVVFAIRTRSGGDPIYDAFVNALG